jgi:RsiW-degrading membrane proteinase PrsW (M82 family)
MPERRPPATGVERAQRTLAVMAAAVIGLTAVAIAVLLVCRAVNVPQRAFASGPLQLLAVLPLPGLAIGLVLLLAVVVVSAIARGRSQRP